MVKGLEMMVVASATDELVSSEKHVLTQQGDDAYVSARGWTLRREVGVTPSGNPIGGRWVLRNAVGDWVDVDQYRFDLAERHALTLG